MVYFITNRKHNVNSESINILNDFTELHNYLDSIDEICFDKEFNDLNELYATPLLTVIGDRNNQFVIDDTSFKDLSHLKRHTNKLFIGHNIKIDIKVARRQGLDIRNVYDTMVVEQRLGLDSKRSNSLEHTYERRTMKSFPISKDIREEFINMDAYSIFENKHIEYAASDIYTLQPIKEVQKQFIDKFNYDLLINKIENPLIPILADMELEGFTIDETKWNQIILDNKKKLAEIEDILDDELLKLDLVKDKGKRSHIEITQVSLFGEVEDKIITPRINSRINYSSSDKVLQLFDSLNIPRPVFVDKSKDKVTGKKSYAEKESIREDALNKYIIEYPNTPIRPFLERLIEYKEITKELSSFGEKFIKYEVRDKQGKLKKGYKNKLTNKVHTIYRQCFTKTGRLASGDADNGYYNSQQIPAILKYREAFTLTQEEIDNDWWITTCDLTGAEVVIMCAFAKDKDLYKWAVEEDDLHSPMATKCWRAIYRYRAANNLPLVVKDSRGGYHTLSDDILIDKENHKQLRVDFKSVTFGVVYGAMPPTVAGTLNIPVTEAKIVVDIIKSAIPATFRMVEKAAIFAKNNAYVVHNNRTNSRKWFFPILRQTKNFEEIHTVESEARNTRIQGTQADMIKEAIVEIYNYYKENNIPNAPLLQIHDELVWKHKGKENGKIIADIMSTVATRYLEGFTEMKAEANTLTTWTK